MQASRHDSFGALQSFLSLRMIMKLEKVVTRGRAKGVGGNNERPKRSESRGQKGELKGERSYS